MGGGSGRGFCRLGGGGGTSEQLGMLPYPTVRTAACHNKG